MAVVAVAARRPRVLSATQWEYASVVSGVTYPGDRSPEGSKVRWRYDARAYVCFASINGCKSEEITQSYARLHAVGENPDTPGAERNVFAKALAQLGSEGWEMVGNGMDADQDNIVFLKRPIQNK